MGLRDMIATGLPWLLSASTIYTMFLAGNKNRHTWAVALVSQTLWLVWIVASATWGLIPGHLCLWAVYVRNHLKWREVL